MSKILTSIAAVALMGAAAMPMSAQAGERNVGVTAPQAQTTEFSSQRRHWRHHHAHRGYRHHGYRHHGYRHHGYRNYGYAGPRQYYADPYPYGYYRPYAYRPGITFGIGPFGLGVF